VPDLRYSNYLASNGWFNVVMDGLLAERGMAPFKSVLNRNQAADIRAYVIARANESKPPAQLPSQPAPAPNVPAPAQPPP
jgi:hypothetical protein